MRRSDRLFPAGTVLKSAQTHIKIFEAFNGRNQNEVAAKFGISVQHVYNIVKRMRKEVIKDIQPICLLIQVIKNEALSYLSL